MKWYNSLHDNLPDHNEKALICVDGVYYTANYDSGLKRFYLEDKPNSYFEVVQSKEIYWLELTNRVPPA